MKKIVLATASWCGPCQAVKAEFKKRGIEFELKDVDEEKSFFTVNEIKTVPQLLVYEDEAEIRRLIGSEIMMEMNFILAIQEENDKTVT